MVEPKVIVKTIRQKAAKKTRHKARHEKLPALATAGMGATGYSIYKTVQEKGPEYLGYAIFGYDSGDKKFHSKKIIETWAPAVMGIGGSALASRFGLNRYIKAIPFIKL